MAETMPGGWSGWSFPLTAEATDAFQQTVGKLLGVNYTPLEFATQVVAGRNYSYFCRARGVFPGATDYFVKIHVYVPLEGAPSITQIVKLDIQP